MIREMEWARKRELLCLPFPMPGRDAADTSHDLAMMEPCPVRDRTILLSRSGLKAGNRQWETRLLHLLSQTEWHFKRDVFSKQAFSFIASELSCTRGGREGEREQVSCHPEMREKEKFVVCNDGCRRRGV